MSTRYSQKVTENLAKEGLAKVLAKGTATGAVARDSNRSYSTDA
jgi:hypothetical protein